MKKGTIKQEISNTQKNVKAMRHTTELSEIPIKEGGGKAQE
jgi:hypothetical protein